MTCEVQTAITRDLFDGGANLPHYLTGRVLVFLHGTPLRPPDVLNEFFVLTDRSLQRFFFFLALERGQDRRLIPHLHPQALDALLLLGCLVAPAGDLTVEPGLGVLGSFQLLEDPS